MDFSDLGKLFKRKKKEVNTKPPAGDIESRRPEHPKTCTDKLQVKKNGVASLPDNTDIDAMFLASENEQTEAPAPQKKPFPPKKTGNSPDPPKDKHGIRHLSGNEDLSKLMVASPGETSPAVSAKEKKKASKKNKAATHNKAGIRILGNQDNLAQLFQDRSLPDMDGIDNNPLLTPHDPADSDADLFKSWIDQDTGSRSTDTLLKHKKGRDGALSHVSISVRDRIKRYPKPESSLDLHGFTALEADRKTDAYVRSAFQSGFFTLRIIVGKGTHSEGRAVLPDIVEDRLVALKREKIVLTFVWENKIKSKSGAVVIYLNRYDR